MQFFGTYAQSIDAKGRVIVPTAFRDALGKDFMLGLNSTANAIAFYPREKWNSILEDLRRLPSTDEVAMDYVRFIAGNSFSNYELDSQGRTIPVSYTHLDVYKRQVGGAVHNDGQLAGHDTAAAAGPHGGN